MLVKPHLNYMYASSAWDPYTITNITNLERVQNAAARFINNTYTRNSSVTALKDSMDWIPLQEERQRSRITCLYKMIHGLMDINYKNFISVKGKRARRGHDQQFCINQVRTDTHANSFFPRTVKAWNNLPPSIVAQPSLNTFKSALKTVLESAP